MNAEAHAQIALGGYIQQQMLINFAINLLLNGVLAYALFRGEGPLSMWGDPAFGPDLVLTGLLLPLILAVLVIWIHRKPKARGRFPSPLDHPLMPVVTRLPNGFASSPAFLGVLGVCAAVATLGLLHLLDVQALSVVAYALFKGSWTGLLAAAVAPLAILTGLSD